MGGSRERPSWAPCQQLTPLPLPPPPPQHPENRCQSSAAAPLPPPQHPMSPENHFGYLPTLPIDYYDPLSSDQYRNATTAAMPEPRAVWNKGFPESAGGLLPDSEILENYLSRLTLSSPAPQPPPPSSYSSPYVQDSDFGLQRQRTLSAARGQFNRHSGYHDYNSNAVVPNTNTTLNSDEGRPNYNNPNRFARAPLSIEYDFWLQNQLAREIWATRNGPAPNLARSICDSPRSWARPNYGGDSSSARRRMSLCENDRLQLLVRQQQQQPTYTTLEEVRGRVAAVARDQHGCRFLQKKFDEGKPEEIETIFLEIKEHLDELMVDPFGNYLIQRLFDVCSEEHISQVLVALTDKKNVLVRVCLDVHGTRVMQKLMEHLTTPDQIDFLVAALRPLTVILTESMNGQHIVQQCLKLFSPEKNQVILNEVANHCSKIATDRSGCCVLQQCVNHAQGEARDRLLAEVASNALVLSFDPYGNYVVQYILGRKNSLVTAEILRRLAGNYVALSRNKHGSNVVEKCLRGSDEEQSEQIVLEIIHSPDFLTLLLDAYGNFVAQSALAVSKGVVHKMLVNAIRSCRQSLQSHLYGKRVLDKIEGNGRQQQQHEHHL